MLAESGPHLTWNDLVEELDAALSGEELIWTTLGTCLAEVSTDAPGCESGLQDAAAPVLPKPVPDDGRERLKGCGGSIDR